MKPQTIFSGIKPSGDLHIGHYFGAIKNWVALQNEYKAIFCIVDEHAITVPQEPAKLRERTLDIAAWYLACGINQEKSLIFVQSQNPDHTQLGWILNTLTPLGELERMTQFKEKAKINTDYADQISENLRKQLLYHSKTNEEFKSLLKKLDEWLHAEKKPLFHSKLLVVIGRLEKLWINSEKESEASSKALKEFIDIYIQRRNTNAGLLNYPTLMAADILLYQTDIVPVGEDQKQHVELARTLARKFNTRFGQTFKEPKELIQKTGARVMSLQNPAKKMSKSDENANSYIALLDSPDEIRRKIKIAVTDSGTEVRYAPAEKPAISNLITLYHLASELSVKDIEKKFAGKGYGDFKKELGERMVEILAPIQQKFSELKQDKKQMMQILAKGAKEAQQISGTTLADAKQKIGFL